MKKLLALAVLALGLCAAPAMAVTTTIDFTDDAFYLGGPDFIFPGLPAGINFHVPDSWGLPVCLDTYRTADGLAVDLAPGESIHINFFGHNTTIKDISFSAIGEGMAWILTPQWFINAIDQPGLNVVEPHILHSEWFSVDEEVVGLAFINYDNSPLTVTIASISLNYDSPAVPVPAAVWLLGTGVAGVAALRRKFK